MIKVTKTLKSILEHVDEHTLFLIDLDNTLLECTTSYGSYEWVSHLIHNKLKEGLSISDALDEVVPMWEEIFDRFEMRLIEKESFAWIDALMKNGCRTLGLTGRSKMLADHTHNQLKEHDVAFSHSLIDKSSFMSDPEVLHHHGVVYIGYKGSKGDALKSILDHLEDPVKKVVFIDDQIRYIKQVQEALDGHTVDFIGLHYTALESKFHDFDHDKAKEEELLFRKST